jgi:hypothetical protein
MMIQMMSWSPSASATAILLYYYYQFFQACSFLSFVFDIINPSSHVTLIYNYHLPIKSIAFKGYSESQENLVVQMFSLF